MLETPREIVKRNAAAYLAAHVVLCAAVITSGTHGRLMLYLLAILGPWCAVSTYRSALRCWHGDDPNPVREVSIPALVCAGVALPVYWLP